MADSHPDLEFEGQKPPARRRGWKRVAVTLLKIAIAVAGIWYVVHTITWNDKALLPAGTQIRGVQFLHDTPVVVLERFGEERQPDTLRPPPTSRPRALHTAKIRFPDTPVYLEINGARYTLPIDQHTLVPGNGELNLPRELLLPIDLFKDIKGRRIEDGLRTPLIAAGGRWYLLVAAWSILVVPFIVSAYRWRALMRPQGINLPPGKCIQLTFVGQFYSIMLPGITGGDLVKIIYTSRLTGSKTKSIITILLDRAVGLIALMVIAGVAAGLQLLWNRQHAATAAGIGDATLRNVLLLILAILGSMALFAVVYFSRRLRTLTGLQRILDHPRMPDIVKHADEVLHRYRGHAPLLVWAFLISVFSQLMLPLSAWLSGLAFGMDANVGYYLAYVPIAVLASSLPISPPQGFGVMDSILVHFFVNRGTARVGQVFALTQAIRFLPILWNLVGAYWVVTGHFKREPVPEGIEIPDDTQPPSR